MGLLLRRTIEGHSSACCTPTGPLCLRVTGAVAPSATDIRSLPDGVFCGTVRADHAATQTKIRIVVAQISPPEA